LAGREADFAAEGHAEIFDVREGGAFGDLFEGQIGFHQELFHAREAHAKDFFVRGSSEEFFESALEQRARLGDGAENVFDFDAVAGVAADEMDGAGDVAIFEDENVGGLARGDADGRDEMGLAARGFAADHFVEERGGFVTGALHIGNDAGERRFGEIAQEFVVIDADDRDVVRDSDADAAAGVENLASAKIVARHNADGFGKALNPFGEIADLLVVVDFGMAGGIVNETIVAGGADGILEMFAAPLGPIETRVAGETEMFEAAFEKMIGGEMGDCAVVGLEPRKRWQQARGADVDDGNGERTQGGGDGFVLDAGEDAMAIPMREPGGGLIAAIVFGKVKGPIAMFANVGDDAAQEAARVGVGGLDQQGDFDGRLHGDALMIVW
jgi:hypothetical protein